MKVTAFAYAYRECQAIFQSEERSFAKHAHFRISRSNRSARSPDGLFRHHPLNYLKPLVLE